LAERSRSQQNRFDSAQRTA